MKNKKRLISLVCAFLAVLFSLGTVAGVLPAHVSAESSGQIKEQIRDMEQTKDAMQAEIDALEKKVRENSGRIEEIAAEKSLIDQEITLLHQQVETMNEQITAYGTLIEEKQAELVLAEAELDRLNEKYKERIRAMEEDGTLSYWSVIFKARSFSDLLDRLSMVEEIAAADSRRLQEMTAAAQAVTEAKQTLQEEKTALEDAKEELEQKNIQLLEKRRKADALLSELMAKGAEFELLLNQSEQRQSALMQQIAAKEAAYDEAKYREWQEKQKEERQKEEKPDPGNNGGGQSSGSATWLTPINYICVTSPFGDRNHPIDGVYRMHYGVDLAANTGTPIYATRSGIVTTKDYEEGGAGNYVVINHLDGYSSIYMHMTYSIVSAEQYVSAGQVIGYCGSTGGSTGPHLHFGISYNGTYVNPANYINI